MPKPKNRAYMSDLLRCVTEIVKIAKTAGETEVIDFLNKEIVMNGDSDRRLLISIIFDEICRHFCITQEMLLEDVKYRRYDTPRMITYYLLYNNANCTQQEISHIFSRQRVWITKKMTEFKNLDENIKHENDILQSYNCIFNKVIIRAKSIS